MADSISFKFLADAFDLGIKKRQAKMPRAAMYAVREAGRVTRKAAAAKAPVLRGTDARSHRQLQRAARQGENVSEAYQRAVPGLLKASIRASRAMRLGPYTYSIKVGPRGPRVHLYAGKQEERTHYMEAGEAAGKAVLGTVAKRAFDKVWAE